MGPSPCVTDKRAMKGSHFSVAKPVNRPKTVWVVGPDSLPERNAMVTKSSSGRTGGDVRITVWKKHSSTLPDSENLRGAGLHRQGWVTE